MRKCFDNVWISRISLIPSHIVIFLPHIITANTTGSCDESSLLYSSRDEYELGMDDPWGRDWGSRVAQVRGDLMELCLDSHAHFPSDLQIDLLVSTTIIMAVYTPPISSLKVQTTSHGSSMKNSSTFSIRIFSPTPHSHRLTPHKRLTSFFPLKRRKRKRY